MIGLFSYLVFFLIIASIFAIVCLGLNLQWGYTGLFNIGIAGFFSVGAYTYAILAGPYHAARLGSFGVPFLPAVALSMLAAGLAALLVGLPTLRLRDDYLAIATIGIASSIQLVATNERWLTGGTQGAQNIVQPLAGTFSSPLQYNLFFLAMMLVFVAVVYLALERMVHSPWGRVLMAIREDETAASSLGKNAFSYRLQSFVIGSMVMGLGGALYASFITFISPEDFLPVLTFQIWAMLIVGGSGSNLGAIVGAVLVWGLWTASGSLAQMVLPADLQVKGGAFQIVLIGLVLMVVLIFRPRGLFGSRKALVSHGAKTPE
jgi:branched-chain amino acid transport system permease protein